MGWVDTLLVIVIIGGLVLAVWAKISKQTVTELIRDLFGFIQEKKEDSIERYLD